MARTISFVLGSVCALGLLFLPAMRGGELTGSAHGLLMLLLLTVCGAFVHGLGFIPQSKAFKAVLRPLALWTLIVSQVVVLALTI